MWGRNSPLVVLLLFLKRCYSEVKKENEPRAKAPVCFHPGPAPNYHRDTVRVLTMQRTVVIMRSATLDRVLPAPPVPAEANDSLSTEKGGGPRQRTSARRIEDDGRAHFNDLDVTLGV